MNKFFFVYTAALLLAACGSQPSQHKSEFPMEEAVSEDVKDKTEEIYVTDAINNPTKYYEDIIESVKLIKLETNENALVQIPCNIATSANYMYIYYEGRDEVFIFDKQGKYVNKISNGQGPNEIAVCESIYYEEKSQTLFVYDYMQQKVLKCKPNGEHISNIYVGNIGMRDFIVDGDKVIYVKSGVPWGDGIYKVCITDTSFKNIDTIYLGKTDFRRSVNKYLNSTDNEIIISKPCNKNVYGFKDGKVFRKYVINNGFKNPKVSSVKKGTKPQELMDERKEMFEGVDNVFDGDFLESKECQYMKFSLCQGGYLNVFRNKKTSEVISPKIKRKSFANYIHPEIVYDYENNVFAGILYTELFYYDKNNDQLDHWWDGSNMNGLLSDEDVEMLKNASPDDNPIIVLFKLKNNI